jgi:hypothetical protein
VLLITRFARAPAEMSGRPVCLSCRSTLSPLTPPSLPSRQGGDEAEAMAVVGLSSKPSLSHRSKRRREGTPPHAAARPLARHHKAYRQEVVSSPELMERVLGFLAGGSRAARADVGRAALVCRLWRDVATGPEMWARRGSCAEVGDHMVIRFTNNTRLMTHSILHRPSSAQVPIIMTTTRVGRSSSLLTPSRPRPIDCR